MILTGKHKFFYEANTCENDCVSCTALSHRISNAGVRSCRKGKKGVDSIFVRFDNSYTDLTRSIILSITTNIDNIIDHG